MSRNWKTKPALMLLASGVSVVSLTAYAGQATSVDVGSTYVAFNPQGSGEHVMVVSCQDGTYIEERSPDGESVTISLGDLSLTNGRCKYELRGGAQPQAGSFEIVDGVATAHHSSGGSR